MWINDISDEAVIVSTICSSCVNSHSYQVVLIALCVFWVITDFLKTWNDVNKMAVILQIAHSDFLELFFVIYFMYRNRYSTYNMY